MWRPVLRPCEPITPLRPRSAAPRAASAAAAAGCFFLRCRLYSAAPSGLPRGPPSKVFGVAAHILSASARRGPLRSPPRLRPRSSRDRRRASRRRRCHGHTPRTMRRARPRPLLLPNRPLLSARAAAYASLQRRRSATRCALPPPVSLAARRQRLALAATPRWNAVGCAARSARLYCYVLISRFNH